MMYLFEKYLELQKETIILYIEHPWIYIFCTIICIAFMITSIVRIAADKEAKKMISDFVYKVFKK